MTLKAMKMAKAAIQERTFVLPHNSAYRVVRAEDLAALISAVEGFIASRQAAKTASVQPEVE